MGSSYSIRKRAQSWTIFWCDQKDANPGKRAPRSSETVVQVYLVDDRGKSEVVTTSKTLPTYKEIDGLLRARVGSRASKSWLEKLMGETKFNLDNKF